MEARGKLAEQKLEAKLAEQRREMESRLERQRAELTAPAQEAISDQQIAALQARLEGLHAAKLLADEVHGMHTRYHIIDSISKIESIVTNMTSMEIDHP